MLVYSVIMIINIILLLISITFIQGHFNKHYCPELYEMCINNNKHVCLEINHIIPEPFICPYYSCSYKCIKKQYLIDSIEIKYNEIGFYLLSICIVISIFNFFYLLKNKKKYNEQINEQEHEQIIEQLL